MIRVAILPDEEALARHAAGLFVTAAGKAVGARGRFLAALSGGGTPQRLFELLAMAAFADHVPWARCHLLWVDERCVPPDEAGSNYGQVRDALLGAVPVPPANVHRVQGELSPEAAADNYARELAGLAPPDRRWPRLDLVLLGMGADGHTASLFPGQAAVAEQRAPVAAVSARYDGRPAQRVTMTLPVINDGRELAFLVVGAGKAAMVAQVLGDSGAADPVPAARVQPRDGALAWLLDEAAAAALPRQLPGGVSVTRPEGR